MKIFTLIALFIASLVSHAATVTNATRQMADPSTAGTRPLSMLGSSLNLDRAVLLKRALASSNHVVLAGSGDSVGDSVLNALCAEIAPWLGTNGYGFNSGSSFYYETNGGAAYLRSPISDATATNWFQDYREIASGGTMTWEPQQLCDTIHVYYVAGTPNKGTFKLLTSTNGAAFTDASNVTVSATYGGAVVTLTVPEGLWRVRAEGLTGTNVIIGARMLGSRRGVHRVGLASSGVSGVEIFRVHTNVLHTVFAHVAPHALFVEEKSDAAFHSTYWPNWLALRAALPNTDFIWLGTTPVAVDDATYSVAQNAVDWSWCFTNGIPYFDSYSVFGSFLNMSNKCGYVDDTHPSDLANVVRTREFLRQFTQPTWITRRGVPAFMSETNHWTYQQTFHGGALMNGLRVTNELEIVGATATLELRDRDNPTGTFDRTDIYREDDRLKFYDTGNVTPLVEIYTTNGIGYLIPNPSWRGSLGFTLGTADDPFRANLSVATVRQQTGSTSNLLTLSDSNGVARVTVSSNGGFGLNTNDTTRSFHVIGRKPENRTTGNGTSATLQGSVIVRAGDGGDSSTNATSVGGTGATVQLLAGNGGLPTASTNIATGGNGGDARVWAASGASPTVGAAVTIGGNAGRISVLAGNGGTPTAGTIRKGGNGGVLDVLPGVGGNAVGTNAGNGGNINIDTGNGGNATSGGTGGNGGESYFAGGDGGNTDTGLAGNGGLAYITGGHAGAASAGGLPGIPGELILTGGNGKTGATNSNGAHVNIRGGTAGGGGAIPGNVLLQSLGGSVGIGTASPATGTSLDVTGRVDAAWVRSTNGFVAPNNSLTVSDITAAITNGGCWVGMLSNMLQAVCMSNNAVRFTELAPKP